MRNLNHQITRTRGNPYLVSDQAILNRWKLTLINNDNEAHDIVGRSPELQMGKTLVPVGEERELSMTVPGKGPGKYRAFCTIHPGMILDVTAVEPASE